MLTRRHALKLIGALPALATLSAKEVDPPSIPPIRPPHLKTGDRVGLVNPAGAIYKRKTIRQIEKTLRSMGLVPVRGPHLLDTYGYLAGRDEDRVADIHEFFANTTISALLAARGGWGCNRLLPLLDFELIRRNPKIVMGYSDITSLLLAIYSQTGLITFHGPVGVSTWNEFTRHYVKSVLFNSDPVSYVHDSLDRSAKNNLLPFYRLNPGTATGILWGGNLSVLAATVGSAYLPNPDGSILFVEDVDEDIYRIDRMLTQLKLAGILDRIAGFIFAQCTGCTPENPEHSLTLIDLMNDHIRPLGIPAWMGLLTGHIEDKFTLPIGAQVTMDVDKGTLSLNQPAVS